MNDAAGAVYAADGVQDAGLAVDENHGADMGALKGAHQKDVALGQDCAFDLTTWPACSGASASSVAVSGEKSLTM